MAEQLAELNKGDLEVYSTTEHIVGTWIDGKTIYRKVWTYNSVQTIDAPNTFSSSGGVWQQTDISSSGMDVIIDCKLVNRQYTLTFKAGMCVKDYNSTGYVGINNCLCRSVSYDVVILEYTKS
jgi:hypothetical protein